MTKKKKPDFTKLLACLARDQCRQELHRTEFGYAVLLRVRRKKHDAWGPAHVRSSLEGITNWMLIYEFLKTYAPAQSEYRVTKLMRESEFDKLIEWVDAGIVTARLS